MPGTQPNISSALANTCFQNQFASFRNAAFEIKGVSGARHQILQSSHSPFTDVGQARQFRAMESLDSGATWNEMDAGNAPAIPAAAAGTGGFTVPTSEYSVCQDFDGKTLWLWRWLANLNLGVQSFDQALKKWGPTVDTGITIEAGGASDHPWNSVFRPSDGSTWVMYDLGVPVGYTNRKTQVIKFLAGVATGPIVLNPGYGDKQDHSFGIALNPTSNIIECVINQEGTGPAFDDFCAMRIKTDDSLTSPVSIPGLTSTQAVLNALPVCSDTGIVSFCYGNTNSAVATVARWMGADAPMFIVDTLNLAADYNGTGVSVAAGGNTNYFVYASGTTVDNTIIWRYFTSAGLGAWDVSPGSVLFTWDRSSGAWAGGSAYNFNSGLLSQAGVLSISMPYNAAGNVALMGQGYFELGSTPPPTPASFVPLITQALIIPFPTDNPCCDPKQVGCVDCSRDGKMYAISKGPYRKATK